MLKISGLLLILYVLFLSPAAAQQQGANECALYKQSGSQSKPTVASPDEDNYDVQHLQFDMFLDHTTAYIRGNVTTTARVVTTRLSTYVFELSDTLQIDSVKVNGALSSFDTSGITCTVPLATPIVQGTSFKAQVFYHGYPRNADDINYPGFHNHDSVTFSSVEPYFAHTWWPCKQSLTDKIDSVDMWITVPAGVKAGSNGTLVAITLVGSLYNRYEWKERYPIDYYLISVALARYDEDTHYMHFTGSNDSMLITNYVPPSLLPKVKPMLDSTALLVDYFSTLFGRYPFWKEKYGHCYTPSFVNMEHQTMTSARLSSLTVIAHELTHQWFGDNVTCGSWNDIWLNEGFATYGQYLSYDHFNGHDTAKRFMHSSHENVLSQTGGTLLAYDTANFGRIFDGRLTYDKGSSVVHMLRFIANDDTKFFKILQAYQQQYAGKTATTADMQRVAESVLLYDLSAFFLQWVYKGGYPLYDVAWNQVNDIVYLRIGQSSSSPSSVPVFSMPVEIKLYSAQGDTTVRVAVNQSWQVFSFLSSKIVDSIAVDPAEWLLCRANKPQKTTALSPQLASVYPNPTLGTAYVAYHDLDNGLLVLYDAVGRKILEQALPGTSGVSTIDLQFFPAGIYTYRIISKDNSDIIGKLLKG